MSPFAGREEEIQSEEGSVISNLRGEKVLGEGAEAAAPGPIL